MFCEENSHQGFEPFHQPRHFGVEKFRLAAMRWVEVIIAVTSGL